MPPIETCRSAITSSSADCTLAGARLISSVSTKFATTGPELDVELLAADPVDAGAEQVGGHQVGGELDPGERATDHPREGLDGQRLGHPRHTLDQQVTLGQQPDQHPLDQPVLPDDHPLDLEDSAFQQRGVGGRGVLHRRSGALGPDRGSPTAQL